MKQRFTALSILCLLAMLSSVRAQTTNDARNRVTAGAVDGRDLIARSRQTLARHASIEAKIRQQIDLFDQQLVGNGAYLQQGTGTEMQVRLELKIQTTGATSSLLQVADRRFLWTETQLNNRRRVNQVDLRKVRQTTKEQELSSYSQPNTGLLVGGLNELLTGIAENFDFPRVKEESLSNVPVYELTGQLSQQALARMFPNKNKEDSVPSLSLDQVPPQVPQQVVVMLGRDDLFPYVVDFRSVSGHQGSSSPGKTTVRMQLFEVRIGGSIDPRRFVYKPGNVAVSDGTAKFIEAWKRRESVKR